MSLLPDVPVALDFFCGAGGAAMGYHLAGFGVIGVDIKPQPNYPFTFIQADVLDVLADADYLRRFDLIHSSPPCQSYSTASHLARTRRPMLISHVREKVQAAGVPYVIENVEGAEEHMQDPLMLCGATFGLRSYRHRLFECSFHVDRPHDPEHIWRQARAGRAPVGNEFACPIGNASDVAASRRALGIPWMTGNEIREAISPRMTRYIGVAARAALGF